jgi:hypothetical protein
MPAGAGILDFGLRSAECGFGEGGGVINLQFVVFCDARPCIRTFTFTASDCTDAELERAKVAFQKKGWLIGNSETVCPQCAKERKLAA